MSFIVTVASQSSIIGPYKVRAKKKKKKEKKNRGGQGWKNHSMIQTGTLLLGWYTTLYISITIFAADYSGVVSLPKSVEIHSQEKRSQKFLVKSL